MHPPSKRELGELADRYGIQLRDGEVTDLVEQVSTLLAGIEKLDSMNVRSGEAEPAERTWWQPQGDRHNAIITECDVPSAGSGLLDDISVAVKDIISVAGIPMTGGSRLLEGYLPQKDATVVRRLRRDGARVVAKTNCDELATSGRGSTSVYGKITNPHDEGRTAGGSSGGSAVAVAEGHTELALGTDTSGSVQLPAAFCGVIGVKPTHGLLPLSGAVEHAYTMDHIGLFSESVEIAAKAVDVMSGVETTDPASLQAAGREEYGTGGCYSAVREGCDLEQLQIGVIEEGISGDVSSEMAAKAEAVLDTLSDNGATIQPISIDGYRYARPINESLSYSQLFEHWLLGASPGRRGGTVNAGHQAAFSRRASGSSRELGTFYKSKLLAGAFLVDTMHARHATYAEIAREELADEFEKAAERFDVLVAPTAPTVAPRFGFEDEGNVQYAQNTRPANVVRHPTVSIPVGAIEGLPAGLQLVGETFGEPDLLAAAATIHGTVA